ncbi:MAG TPA: EAL domain-containing protein, partial [Lachnospiraceae bacterium]|nr:EAL domain-containing protein [Lachnospiraceae bacterium]
MHRTLPDTHSDYLDANNVIKKELSLNPYYKNIVIYGSDYNTLLNTVVNDTFEQNSDQELLAILKQTDTVGRLIYSPDERTNEDTTLQYIKVGSPIYRKDSHETVGYVVITINLAYLDDVLDKYTIGRSTYSMIFTKQGKLLYQPKDSIVNESLNAQLERGLTDARKKNPSFGLLSNNRKLSNTMYSYYKLDRLDAYLVIAEDKSSVLKLYQFVLLIVLIGTIALLTIILISSTKLAKRFTAPLIDLRDCMRQAANGNLNTFCDVKSKDEFGELSRSFNKMLHIIKSNYNDLTVMHNKLLVKEEQLRSNYEHIEFLAYHDALTNLPNKTAFYDYLNDTLNHTPGYSQSHAIFFIDLDNFKTVNDTLGHDYGDELLVQTSKKLSTFIHSLDLLARAGGDEFLYFKSDIQSDHTAYEFASRILEGFKDPFNIHGTLVYITLSIGISLYPLNGRQYDTLIRNADIAMYKSKDTGKNKLTLFDESMQLEVSRHSDIVEILRHAIEQDEVYLVYQPQFEITSERIIGFEALMRIRSKKLGPISPCEFIPIAEESGLINELGAWALRQACIFNKELQNYGFPPCTVAVNVSTIQLNQKNFISMVADILEETNLSPEYLELEITESAVISSFEDTVALLEKLHVIGVKVSLDDFGTGYSSLNYLTQMPINTLKIDKAFIDKINNNPKDNYVAEAIISLAHNLNVKVIAEGVEDNIQLSLLREKHCDLIQGYLFSKPLEPEDLKRVIEACFV